MIQFALKILKMDIPKAVHNALPFPYYLKMFNT